MSAGHLFERARFLRAACHDTHVSSRRLLLTRSRVRRAGALLAARVREKHSGGPILRAVDATLWPVRVGGAGLLRWQTPRGDADDWADDVELLADDGAALAG